MLIILCLIELFSFPEETDFLPRTDDIYLLRFLRVRKFDLERAYKLLRDHYKFRAKNPDCFPAPSTIEKVLKANIFNYLPHRDHLGRAIFLVKMGKKHFWKNPLFYSRTNYCSNNSLMRTSYNSVTVMTRY